SASRAIRVASPGPSVRWSVYGRFLAWSVRSSSGISWATWLRPARGFTITVSGPNELAISRVASHAGVRDHAAVDRVPGSPHGLARRLRRDVPDLPQEIDQLLAVADEVPGRHRRLARGQTLEQLLRQRLGHEDVRLPVDPREHRALRPDREAVDVLQLVQNLEDPIELDRNRLRPRADVPLRPLDPLPQLGRPER